ncbi:hypothetical protein BDY24DRAFT_187495 [Mrakia frigida]|uniref:uncharacterized protein n=1 Tax=Mrakia frigida TaxID=29902 RepID=UPI003FCBEF87
MSRIPSRSHKPTTASIPTTAASSVPSRLVLSTPPELLSWLVDDLQYLPPSSSSSSSSLSSSGRAAIDPWGRTRDTKELKLADVNRFCRGSIHLLLHHLSLHLLGRLKVSHIRSEIHRLQSPLTNSHLSRPTLQTLFPPTTSSYQINLTSLTQLAKLDARLASLQSTFDALLSADEERTDEEMIALEIKRDALMRAGERWRVSLGAIEAVGEMVELEGGGGEAERITLSLEDQKTELSTLLQSISSYIAFPSTYTEPSNLTSRMVQVSPQVLLETLRNELERSLELISVQSEAFEDSDAQHARDALLELHLLHLSLSDDRRASLPGSSKRVELNKRLDEKLRKEFGSNQAGMERRRTEILAQVDLRVARRVKPNLVPKLSSYGQDLLARRVETREKLVELEEERSTLSTEIASLQAVYDSLVASSSALTLETHTSSSETLPSSLLACQTSLGQLDGTLERELGVVNAERWEEKVGRTLGMGGGDERREFGKLLGVGEVAMSFNGLVTMLKSLIDDRTRLEILSKQMLAPRTAVEDQSRLFDDIKTQEQNYIASALQILVDGRREAEEQMSKTKEEFERSKRERDAILGGRFLKRSTREPRERVIGGEGRTRR